MQPLDCPLGKTVLRIKEGYSRQIQFSSFKTQQQVRKDILSRFKAQAQTDKGPDSPSYLRVHSRPVQDNKYKIIISHSP
jgi:hypothetical protein